MGDSLGWILRAAVCKVAAAVTLLPLLAVRESAAVTVIAAAHVVLLLAGSACLFRGVWIRWRDAR
jgi:hypothetical protein